MKTTAVCKGLKRNLVLLATAIFLFMPIASTAKNYHKLVSAISVGMDSLQVIETSGEPTKVIDVRRWFYVNDEVVILNGEVIDIRLSNRDRKVRLRRQEKDQIGRAHV